MKNGGRGRKTMYLRKPVVFLCIILSTATEENFCYNELDLLVPDLENLAVSMDASCVTTSYEFEILINIAVLETLFHLPKINWTKRARPAGPNSQHSMR